MDLPEFKTIELVAAGLGLVNVGLVALRSVWNYPFGIAMVALFAWIFFEAKLYSDALLQLFFIVVQLYGWWYWARGRAETGEVMVEVLPWRARFAWLAGCAVATAGWGALMHYQTDAVFPWWDAAIAMLSVAAQILLSRRFVENWMLWIAVDVLAVPLYAARGLHVPAALYVVFLGISVAGLIGWTRSRRAQRA